MAPLFLCREGKCILPLCGIVVPLETIPKGNHEALYPRLADEYLRIFHVTQESITASRKLARTVDCFSVIRYFSRPSSEEVVRGTTLLVMYFKLKLKKVNIIDPKQGFVASINKEIVEQFEILSEKSKRSTGNIAIRGFVGTALLGPLGFAANVLSSIKKGIHQAAIHFKDGKRSLVEVNDKFFRIIMTQLF